VAQVPELPFLRRPFLILFEVVEALLVGFGDVGQAINEPERVGKPCGGVGEPCGRVSEPRGRLLFEVAVQGGKQLDALSDGVYPFR